MEKKDAGQRIVIFFCQQIDKEQDVNRRVIEKKYGDQIRFFPVPCSGRVEPLHLMRALESGADKVYVITCPEGACRYREGNTRLKKRLAYAQGLVEEIGIAKESLKFLQLEPGTSTTIDKLARGFLAEKSPAGVLHYE